MKLEFSTLIPIGISCGQSKKIMQPTMIEDLKLHKNTTQKSNASNPAIDRRHEKTIKLLCNKNRSNQKKPT